MKKGIMKKSYAINGLIRMGVNFEKTQDFIKYHQENLWIWDAFESAALDGIKSGRTKMGAKELFERIRWNPECGGVSDQTPLFALCSDGFKLSNNYTALYARLFIVKYPQYKKSFSLKEL